MKNRILFFPVFLLVCLFFFCERQRVMNPMEAGNRVSISAKILFKIGNTLVSPDSVAFIRLTVTYGSFSAIDTFDFSSHHGVMQEIPINTPFTLKMEGLDGSHNVIYEGLQNYSGCSGDSTVTITASMVSPLMPSNLVLQALDTTRIEIQWRDNSINENGFIIERSLDDDLHFMVVDTVSVNLQQTIDVNLAAGQIYYYRLRAYNSAGYSSYCGQQAVMTYLSGQDTIDTLPPTLLVDTIPDTAQVESVLVSGRVFDKSGIYTLKINNQSVTPFSDSTFSVKIKLDGFRHDSIMIIASDNSPRRNTDTTKIIVLNLYSIHRVVIDTSGLIRSPFLEVNQLNIRVGDSLGLYGKLFSMNGVLIGNYMGPLKLDWSLVNWPDDSFIQAFNGQYGSGNPAESASVTSARPGSTGEIHVHYYDEFVGQDYYDTIRVTVLVGPEVMYNIETLAPVMTVSVPTFTDTVTLDNSFITTDSLYFVSRDAYGNFVRMISVSSWTSGDMNMVHVEDAGAQGVGRYWKVATPPSPLTVKVTALGGTGERDSIFFKVLP